MDFSNFFISYVFDVNESVFRSFTRPLCSGDVENPSQLPVLLELEGTDVWVLWIFVISFISYIFKVNESISRSFTKLPESGDLKHPGQLPVSEVLKGTVDWVLWISVISSFLTFSMSRNLFFVVSHCCSVRVTSKIQVNFWFCRNSRVLTIGSYRFS